MNFTEFRESPWKWVVIGAVVLLAWMLMRPRAAAPATYSMADPMAAANANTAIQAGAANQNAAMQAAVTTQSNFLAAMVQMLKINAAKAVAINTNESALAHDNITAGTQRAQARAAVRLGSVQGNTLISLAGISSDTQKVIANQQAFAAIEQAQGGVSAQEANANGKSAMAAGNLFSQALMAFAF